MPTPRVISINSLDELPAAIARIIESVARDVERINYRPFMQQRLVDFMERMHAEAFRMEVEPETGRAWERLSPRTVRLKGHSVRMVETNALQKSLAGRHAGSAPPRRSTRKAPPGNWSIRRISSISGGAVLEFGTRRPHAWKHMKGYEGIDGIKLPARPHVGLSDKNADEIAEMVADEVIKKLRNN